MNDGFEHRSIRAEPTGKGSTVMNSVDWNQPNESVAQIDQRKTNSMEQT